MSLTKAIGTVVLCLLLLFSTALSAVSGLLTFVVLNPTYYKAMLPTKAYCDELRERIGENLDHVAILYGLSEGSLNEIVTDADIRAYTGALIDELFNEQTTETLTLPAFPTEGFAAYLRAHTAYSEQAITDISEDCAASVSEDLAAVNVGLIVQGFARMRDSRLSQFAPILFLASALLTVILIAMAIAAYAEERRARGVVVWGGLFLGTATLFVPLSQFWLFDFVGRLNISVSAFRTILTGFLNTALYGCLTVLGIAMIGTFLLLMFACLRNKRKRRS